MEEDTFIQSGQWSQEITSLIMIFCLFELGVTVCLEIETMIWLRIRTKVAQLHRMSSIRAAWRAGARQRHSNSVNFAD